MVAALINYTTLIVIGLYLLYEAVVRFIDLQPVAGWIIVVIAGIALVVDIVTAMLTYAMSRDSLNIRAAFLHNVTDALGSVAVIVAGTRISGRWMNTAPRWMRISLWHQEGSVRDEGGPDAFS